MEITTWFGTFDLESGEATLVGDVSQMVDRLDALSSKDLAAARAVKTQPDLRALALECDLFRDCAEYNKILRMVAIKLVRMKLRAEANAEAELLQTIETLDDLNGVINRLDERLYEWSRLYREDRLRGRRLAESLDGEDLIGELARLILELRRSRQSVERNLETATNQITPNLAELVGPLLAARLISRAGGLKHLSEMPASAIQVMGAEKALFKHLKGKAPSPKHGMIYRHPAIMRSPKRLRGRAARALATKLAIAARIDRFSGELNQDLKPKLDKRIEEIRQNKKEKKTRKRSSTHKQNGP
ncbi:MAG: NOP5/NOP56 family protein [Methanotrichaceae archaeon]